MENNERIKIEKLFFSYDQKNIIDNLNLHVKKGEFIGIIGPNGSGKSTALKNVYRSLSPDSGSIFLDGKNIETISFKNMAKELGVVSQENYIPFDFKVKDIVAMGRSPHKKLFESDSKEDLEIIRQSLQKVGMENMADRSFKCLSGGEKQRVIIARVLAQKTEILILDEPTNHLDISHQLAIFDLVKGLGVTVLSAIHDLNIAAMYCDRIYILKDGKFIGQGSPEELLTCENIKNIYGINADIRIHPVTKKVCISYIPDSLMDNN